MHSGIITSRGVERQRVTRIRVARNPKGGLYVIGTQRDASGRLSRGGFHITTRKYADGADGGMIRTHQVGEEIRRNRSKLQFHTVGAGQLSGKGKGKKIRRGKSGPGQWVTINGNHVFLGGK